VHDEDRPNRALNEPGVHRKVVDELAVRRRNTLITDIRAHPQEHPQIPMAFF